MADSGFDPFFDWTEITDEMAEDLRAEIKEYMASRDVLVKKGGTKNAARFMQAQHQLNITADAIMRTLYTVPMMVHVAGDVTRGLNEEGSATAAQICKRCGSPLAGWKEGIAALTPQGPVPVEEEDVTWWEVGALIAKASDEEMGNMTMYLIENRDLDKHEMMCPDFAGELGTK